MGLQLPVESHVHSASVMPTSTRPAKDHKVDGAVCPAAVDPNLSDEDGESVDNNEDDKMPLLQRDDSESEKDSPSSLSPENAGDMETKLATPVVNPRPRLLGVAYILGASLAFSVMTACVKYATRAVSSPEIVFWRALISWIMNYGIVRWKHVNLCVDRQYRLLLLFRCCIGSFCISLHFFSLTMMSVTDSIVILFTSPVMTFILGKLILKEPIEHVEFLCALMSYGGVVFVAKPAFLFPSTELNEHHVPMIATVAVLSAAFFQSCTQIAIRLLKPVHFLAITHYFGLFNVGLGLATMAVFKIGFVCSTEWDIVLVLIMSGLSSCVGMLWLTLGFQIEKAGIASSLRYIDVVLAFIIDFAILGAPVKSDSLIGGAIILTGAIIIAFRRVRAKNT